MLSTKIEELITAGFAGLWVQTGEPDEVEREVARLGDRTGWPVAVWDLARGLVVDGKSNPQVGDPIDALRNAADIAAAGRAAAAGDGEGFASILLLPNYHRFLNDPTVISEVLQAIRVGKVNGSFLVIVAPVVDLPAELEKAFVVVSHELPDADQLESILREVADDGDIPDDGGLARVLDAAAGLTRYEAEGAFALSLVRSEKIDPAVVWEVKAGALQKAGLLQLHKGDETFADLGGLDNLKSFCLRALDRKPDAIARPRGVVLLGVPGTGKSAFAKALGNEVGRPTLSLDVGRLFGGIVGATEQNTREVLATIDAMAPAILFVDEVEKAFGGSNDAGAQGDSGAGKRMLGSFLTWLNDHDSDIFVVVTSNDIASLPEAFTRAERFDGIFFLDLPSPAQKDAIWPIYESKYRVDRDQANPVNDESWTGAEIRSCARLAALLDVPLVEAAQNVVPVALTAAEGVNRLRDWAGGRCLSTEVAGVYTRNPAAIAAAGAEKRRSVRRTSKA